jgi:CubicO group peptidase (beta-lactamase class C family)
MTLLTGIEAEVTRLVEAEIANGQLTGVAISLAAQGGVLWEEGFGLADVTLGRPVTADTAFSLASVTKAFTATAIMTLVQDGQMALDRPVVDYLATPLRRSDFDATAITLRLLGGHAGGLPTLFGMIGDSGDGLSFVESFRDFARMVYPAGERYEYSNVGYSLLGEVASTVTGRNFASILSDNLVGPMGLRNTFYRSQGHRLAEAAIGYDAQGVTIAPYSTATPPSGELYASAHDLSLFAGHMMESPLDGRQALLRTPMLSDMFATVYQGGRDAFTTFGWEGAHFRGERIIVKRGGQPGVSARLTMLPERKVSIAVVANRSDRQPVIDTITAAIARRFIPGWRQPELDPVDAICRTFEPSRFRGTWKGTIDICGTICPMVLELGERSSFWQIGDGDQHRIEAMDQAHDALAFTTNGVIPGRIRQEQILAFKLVERDGRMIGRCLAMIGGVWLVSMLSHVMTLSRD